jgi:hypothetical protein
VACVTFAVMGRTARPEGTSAVTFVPHVLIRAVPEKAAAVWWR